MLLMLPSHTALALKPQAPLGPGQCLGAGAQLGFVPGRRITEATHLLKLVQAIMDERDEEAILVAADWEKAFDRVS